MRRADWVERLHLFIEARRAVVYCVGVSDCCLFCADWVQELTGRDPAENFRGSYATEAEMAAILERYGGMQALVSHLLKIEPKGPICARRGDIVMARTPYGDAVGICVGHEAAFVTATELNFRPLERCACSWAVD